MKCLAIIPARSGSKGLPNKNIKDLCGKPLMVYTLEAAVESGVFDTVMVSTDSQEYANIALQIPGVEVPFLRSVENSQDNSSTWDAVREVLLNYKDNGIEYDMFCVLQITSPMRNAKHIQEAFQLYKAKEANSIVSVCEMDHPLNICNYLPEDHSLVGFIRNGGEVCARQLMRKSYRINGAIYMCKTQAFLQIGSIYREKCYAHIMDTKDSVDIDTIDDFNLAEFLFKEKK